MAKKNKNADAPLDPAGDKMGKYSVKTSSKKINKREALIRILTIILVILLLFLFGLFACTTYIQSGNFTVTTDSNSFNAGLGLSETGDFSKPQRILQGGKFEDMKEGTFPLLPEDIDQHNGTYKIQTDAGMYYYTYSFYVKNTGTEDGAYTSKLNIESATQGADEALRIMVIRDGEGTVYAKPQLNTSNVLEEFADKNFVSNRVVANINNDEFKAGSVEKITVVIWFEGEDPECVDDILEGEVKLSMDFRVTDQQDINNEAEQS